MEGKLREKQAVLLQCPQQACKETTMLVACCSMRQPRQNKNGKMMLSKRDSELPLLATSPLRSEMDLRVNFHQMNTLHTVSKLKCFLG